MNLADLNGNIVNSAPISIMVLDKKGEIVFVNRYFKKFSGSKHPLSRNIKDTPFFIREGLCPLYERLLSAGEPFEKQKCQTTNLSGKTVYLDIVAVPLKNNKGRVEQALSMALDVTKEVETTLKLGELNDELEKKVQERTSQLNKYLKLKSEFVADASHELRTPLAIIKLQMDLLRQENENAPVFETIDEEIHKITEILSNLTFMTSVEEGREKIVFKILNFEKILESTIKRMSLLADKKRIKIFYKKKNLDYKMKGDAEKLERMFLNIIRNAIKYGKEGGWIRIETESDSKNKFIQVNISDNGIGIPKKDLPHIFDRFYRSDLCIKYGQSGFGLGLAICRWIAEKHKGSISAKSILDKGSTFMIKLPIL